MVVVGSDARYEAQKHAVEQAQGLQAGAAQEARVDITVMQPQSANILFSK